MYFWIKTDDCLWQFPYQERRKHLSELTICVELSPSCVYFASKQRKTFVVGRKKTFPPGQLSKLQQRWAGHCQQGKPLLNKKIRRGSVYLKVKDRREPPRQFWRWQHSIVMITLLDPCCPGAVEGFSDVKLPWADFSMPIWMSSPFGQFWLAGLL